MYVLKIPNNRPQIIEILDKIIDGSTLHVSDAKLKRMLGIYVKPWHRNGFIGIYKDIVIKDSVVKFNVKNIKKQDGVGKRTEYIIDDSCLKTNKNFLKTKKII